MSDPLHTRAWLSVRLYVLARDGYLCQIRGPRCTKFANAADHIIPLADGGPEFDPKNLRAACKRCNSGRAADRMNQQRRYRLSVAQYETRM
jgi:5-methylcytosine-specific restriction enzyme A